jgi:hypothetical protein
MDTIFVQPIFAPDQKRFERNLDSLTSFFKYCDHYKYDVKFAVGGWCKDEYWTKFVDLVNGSYAKNKVTLLRFENNYGKAAVVNSLYAKVKEKNIDFKYMLTADSDIVFPIETEHMFDRLEDVAVKSVPIRKMPFGMCGLQQLGHGCHFQTIYQNEYTIDNRFGNKDRIVYPHASSGIAGGCLFFAKDAWDKIGGYRVQGVYAGDDAYALVDIARNGYSYQVADKIGIIHPHEDDAEYAKWKVKVCQRDTNGIVKQNLDSYINEANDFWKNRT